MSSFDVVGIPQSSRREVDELFEKFTNEFCAIGNIHIVNTPAMAAKIYYRASTARYDALYYILNDADFTQYALAVGEFCALVSLLQDILK